MDDTRRVLCVFGGHQTEDVHTIYEVVFRAIALQAAHAVKIVANPKVRRFPWLPTSAARYFRTAVEFVEIRDLLVEPPNEDWALLDLSVIDPRSYRPSQSDLKHLDRIPRITTQEEALVKSIKASEGWLNAPTDYFEREAPWKSDGRTHINVYSGGMTKIGRRLSNFTPLEKGTILTSEGEFLSIEGYWYYLLIPAVVRAPLEAERLRKLHGIEAKRLGGGLVEKAIERMGADAWLGARLEELEFRRRIMRAIVSKLGRGRGMVAEFLQTSPLPLTHYYVFQGLGGQLFARRGEGQWIILFLERLRGLMAAHKSDVAVLKQNIRDLIIELTTPFPGWSGEEPLAGQENGADRG